MKPSSEQSERRARRMMRTYPKTWRARYGDEFAELLMSEIDEKPRSWRRTFNVAGTGVLTRMMPAGAAGPDLGPSEQTRACVATLGCALAVFLTIGIAMWSQLTIGWQWARPDSVGTTVAMIVMTSAVLLFGGLGLLAALPIAWSVLVRFAQGRGQGLLLPTLLLASGITLLIVGGHHFGNGWPGTGGHPWADRGIVPGGVAAFTWATTLSISSYWMHPGALSLFPIAEVAWMIVSPVAIVGVVIGAASTVRRLDLSPGILRYESRLGSLASFVMIAFLTGCCFWMIDGGTGPRRLFNVGGIDVLETVAMGLSLVVARTAVHRSLSGSRSHSVS